ncbi:NFATC2-interacting protein isoform X3 [Petromyzon marinus]|uniref:NFATC2-interacting protein n=1 Tax=Petromyzon marinus TaxID=7757 RepID=A0AAJ7TUS7_PETMA|nr:NFATC2-interacting protein isoform X4 [Petromyzon marinus]
MKRRQRFMRQTKHKDEEAGCPSPPLPSGRTLRRQRRPAVGAGQGPSVGAGQGPSVGHPCFGDIDDEKQRDYLDLEVNDTESCPTVKKMKCVPKPNTNFICISDSDEDLSQEEDSWKNNSPAPPSPPAPRPRLQQRPRRSLDSKILEVDRLLSACRSEVDTSGLDDSLSLVPPPDAPKEEVTAKVRCQSKVHRIKLLHDECFHSVVSHIAITCEVEPARVSLFLQEKEISPTDTPLSVQLSITDIIECIITKSALAREGPTHKPANAIALKVQSKEKNSIQIITIGKTEPLSVLMEKYTALVGSGKQRLVFVLDGADLDGTSTPHELDLEDGDLIDVRVM